jgi:hypothetical protein
LTEVQQFHTDPSGGAAIMPEPEIFADKVTSHLEDLTEKLLVLHGKITRLEFGLLFTIILMFLLFIFRLHL